MSSRQENQDLDFMSQLLLSGKYSDFRLRCQNVEFQLHKSVVCMQSPMFAAALDGNFTEAASGTIDVELFDIDTIRRLIQFFYIGDYNTENPSDTKQLIIKLESPSEENLTPAGTEILSAISVADQLRAHIDLNIAADYYQVPDLLKMTRDEVEKLLQHHWNASAFPELFDRVSSVVADTKLQSIVTDAAARHLEELLQLKEFRELGCISDMTIKLLSSILEANKSTRSPKLKSPKKRKSTFSRW
ncbi:unnamed protein product [Clonostachys rhizophaga]|uniref:BTB domain-containing protein n=1 Tax=Clonostachys rhizophaga TaxID=160324 RepID=A0A9N9VQG8_9HYPO|nr:unnamed protein product [Clonostachys rhizophaga]